jgi:hypothetical protein
VEGRTFRLADAVRYIQGRAANHDSRIVAIGPLHLFSPQSGDAWIPEGGDHLAAPLARDGEPLPVDIEESDTGFSVQRTGSFRIADDALIYRPQKTRNVRTILDYPIRQLSDRISDIFG